MPKKRKKYSRHWEERRIAATLAAITGVCEVCGIKTKGIQGHQRMCRKLVVVLGLPVGSRLSAEQREAAIIKQRHDYYLSRKEEINRLGKIRWHENKERYSANAKEWRQKNAEAIKKHKQEYVKQNAERVSEIKKQCRLKKIEQYKAREAAYYAANKEAIARQAKKHRQSPAGRAKSNELTRKWKQKNRDKARKSHLRRAQRIAIEAAKKYPPRLCACGCGKPTKPSLQNRPSLGIKIGEPQRFLPSHNRRGAKMSPESLRRMSVALKGKNTGPKVARIKVRCIQCNKLMNERTPSHVKRFCSKSCSSKYAGNIRFPPETRDERHRKDRLRAIEKSKEWSKANPERRREIVRASERRISEKRDRDRERKERRPQLQARNSGRKVRNGETVKPEGRHTGKDIKRLYVIQEGFCANPLCREPNSEDGPRHLVFGFDMDHIIPVSRGGSNYPSNLQLLCPRCNRQKRSMTMEEFIEWQIKRKEAIVLDDERRRKKRVA